MNNNRFSIDKIGSLATLVTAIAFGMSVAFNFGFFRYFGIGLQQVPLTLSDYVRSSVTWAPVVFFSIMFILASELVLRRIEKGQSEEEIIESSPASRITRAFRRSPAYLIPAGVSVLIVILLVSGTDVPLGIWEMALVVSWVTLHGWSFSHPRIRQETTVAFFWATRWIPLAAVIMIFYGLMSAESAAKGKHERIVVSTTAGSYEVQLIRAFDDYLFLWEPAGEHWKMQKRAEVLSYIPVPRPNE